MKKKYKNMERLDKNSQVNKNDTQTIHIYKEF